MTHELFYFLLLIYLLPEVINQLKPRAVQGMSSAVMAADQDFIPFWQDPEKAKWSAALVWLSHYIVVEQRGFPGRHCSGFSSAPSSFGFGIYLWLHIISQERASQSGHHMKRFMKRFQGSRIGINKTKEGAISLLNCL